MFDVSLATDEDGLHFGLDAAIDLNYRLLSACFCRITAQCMKPFCLHMRK